MATDTSWEITGQTANQTVITDAGEVITGVRVYFLTGRGQRGTVFIPDDQYNTQSIGNAVSIAAGTMDDVKLLNSASFTSGQ